MIGNEEDFTACLGFEVEGNDANLKKLNIDGYCKMLSEVVKVYPNFKAIGTTLRSENRNNKRLVRNALCRRQRS